MNIPHNEAHRFLEWGPNDSVFECWLSHFDKKTVPYEVAYNPKTGEVTLYKHMTFTNMATGQITKCCVDYADPYDIDWYGEADGDKEV